MFDGIRKKLTRVAEEEEEIKFKDIEEKTAPEAIPEKPACEESHANSSIEGNNIELKVVRPESIDEIFTIADYLIDGCTVVLNLENTNKETSRRLIDFLSGVAYSIGGSLKKIATNAYVITPSNVDVGEAQVKQRRAEPQPEPQPQPEKTFDDFADFN